MTKNLWNPRFFFFFFFIEERILTLLKNEEVKNMEFV